jgi:hypothetical protein
MNADERGYAPEASSPGLHHCGPVDAAGKFLPLFDSAPPFQTVIAGLDPAIQESRIAPTLLARRLDCRVKPGNDSLGLDVRCVTTAIAGLGNEKDHLRSSALICGFLSSRSRRGVERPR